MKQTPLNAVHRALGAKMVDFGGWDMPVQYSGIIDEHHAVRTRRRACSTSATWARSRSAAREALDLVDYVTTNAVAQLKTGQVHYSGLLYEHGGFVDDILVHKVADDHYFLCVNASNQEKDFEHIRAHEPLRTPRWSSPSDRYAQLAIQGPRALATLQKLTAGGPGRHPLLLVRGRRSLRRARRASRAPATPARTASRSTSPPERSRRASGTSCSTPAREFGIKPCGLGARNTLRLEAKMALYGHEIDASITPLEADLGWIVKLDKGDFVGRDALVKQQGARASRASWSASKCAGAASRRDGYEVLRRRRARGLGHQRRALAHAEQEHRAVLSARRHCAEPGRAIQVIDPQPAGRSGHG